MGIPNATVTSTPTATAFVDSGATIIAGGDVTVNASALNTASTPTSDLITGVDPSDDTITFPSHGLVDGDIITYSQGTSSTPIQTPTGPLDPTRQYQVVVVDGNTIKLGATFDASQVDAGNPLAPADGVDPTRDEIQFSTPDLFQTGDAVHFDTNGNTSIITTDPNGTGTYYVRVIDPYTIKLYATQAEAMAVVRVVHSESGDQRHLQFQRSGFPE